MDSVVDEESLLELDVEGAAMFEETCREVASGVMIPMLSTPLQKWFCSIYCCPPLQYRSGLFAIAYSANSAHSAENLQSLAALQAAAYEMYDPGYLGRAILLVEHEDKLCVFIHKKDLEYFDLLDRVGPWQVRIICLEHIKIDSCMWVSWCRQHKLVRA